MVQLAHDGLELWYGTPDSTGARWDDRTTPRGLGHGGRSARQSLERGECAVPRRRAGRRNGVGAAGVQRLPKADAVLPGDVPHLLGWRDGSSTYPVVSCEGRRAPDPATASTFLSSFRLGEASPTRRLPPQRPSDPQGLFPVRVDHVARARVHLAREPEFFGDTQAGFVINWPPGKWHPRWACVA